MIREAAAVGLRPAEFWELTPREFRLFAQGYNRAQAWERQSTAAFFASLMNRIPSFGKRKPKSIKPEDLTGLTFRRRGKK